MESKKIASILNCSDITPTLKLSFRNKYFELLMTEAANTPVKSHDVSLPSLHWVNPYLIREGQAFFKRNLDSVIFAHFVGISIVFSYKPIASVLLRTGGTHVKYNSRMRWLSTILHFKKWYESEDLLHKTAKAVQDVYSVRKLHAKVIDLLLSNDSYVIDEQDIILNKDEESLLKTLLHDTQNLNVEDLPEDFNSYEPEILMSQFDMVMFQYAFVGFIAMAPQTFGIHDRMGLMGFIHIWSLIGNLLGIEDRFNIGLQQDQECLELISKVIFVPCMKRIDDGIIALWRGLVEGARKFAPFLKTKPILYFIYKDVLKIPAHGLYSSMSKKEKFSYYRQTWELNHAKRNSTWKKFRNVLTRMDLHFAAKSLMRNTPNY